MLPVGLHLREQSEHISWSAGAVLRCAEEPSLPLARGPSVAMDRAHLLVAADGPMGASHSPNMSRVSTGQKALRLGSRALGLYCVQIRSTPAIATSPQVLASPILCPLRTPLSLALS